MGTKVLKVKIGRNKTAAKTSYSYPKEYDPKKFQVLCYESMVTHKLADVVGRDATPGGHEYVLGFVKDEDVAGFLVSPDIVEVNRTETEEFLGADLEKSTEKITDTNAVMLVLAKVARNEILTEEDKKTIDSSDATAGVSKSRTLKDALDENNI